MNGPLRTVGDTAVYLRWLLMHWEREELGYAMSETTKAKKVVLLVPGFLGTRGSLHVLGRRFARVGYPAYSLDPGIMTLLPHSRVLAALMAKIREMRSMLPWIEQFDIVGHSQGGLMAYDAIEAGALDGLDSRLVTLGSPFRGTWAGILGGGLLPGATELLPVMRRYRELGREPRSRKVRFLSIAGSRDSLAPAARCAHPEAEIAVMDASHAGLVVMKAVFERTLAFLEKS